MKITITMPNPPGLGVTFGDETLAHGETHEVDDAFGEALVASGRAVQVDAPIVAEPVIEPATVQAEAAAE